MAMQEKFTTEYDNLFAANQMMPVVTDSIKIPSGTAEMKRGTLLSEKGAVAASAEEVFGVLAEDVDASEADVETVIYLTGEFNMKALNAGELAVEDCKTAARKIGIFIKSNVE